MKAEEIIIRLRDGSTPTICGTGFNQKQIDEIKEILELRKKRIDDYFKITIQTRLIK